MGYFTFQRKHWQVLRYLSSCFDHSGRICPPHQKFEVLKRKRHKYHHSHHLDHQHQQGAAQLLLLLLVVMVVVVVVVVVVVASRHEW